MRKAQGAFEGAFRVIHGNVGMKQYQWKRKRKLLCYLRFGVSGSLSAEAEILAEPLPKPKDERLGFSQIGGSH